MKYLVKSPIRRAGKRVKTDDGFAIEHQEHEAGDVIDISEKEAAAMPHAVEPVAEKPEAKN